MLNEYPIEDGLVLPLKETVKTKILIQFRPMNSGSIGNEIAPLLLRGVSQTGIINETFFGLFTIFGSDPDSGIRKPYFLYLDHLSFIVIEETIPMFSDNLNIFLNHSLYHLQLTWF